MLKKCSIVNHQNDNANDSGGVAGERKRFPARIAAGEAESEETNELGVRGTV